MPCGVSLTHFCSVVYASLVAGDHVRAHTWAHCPCQTHGSDSAPYIGVVNAGAMLMGNAMEASGGADDMYDVKRGYWQDTTL